MSHARGHIRLPFFREADTLTKKHILSFLRRQNRQTLSHKSGGCFPTQPHPRTSPQLPYSLKTPYSAIVCAARGNHSRCRPIFGACRNLPGGGDGVFIESVDRARVKTAIPSYSVGIDPPSSVGFDLARLSDLRTVSREGVLIDSGVTRKTKIIQFPENIDKLTSVFR